MDNQSLLPKNSLDKAEGSGEFQLPVAAMVRALCQAAVVGPGLLYEVLLKLTLMIDATAQTYGLSTWTQKPGERPQLEWAEGLNQEEIDEGETAVVSALGTSNRGFEIKAGDRSLCLVLSVAGANRDSAAIYGRCARPLTEGQAKSLRILSDVAQLTHAHVALLSEQFHVQSKVAVPSVATSTLPGMIFSSPSMAAVAGAVERIKDSDSTVLVTGESGTG
jgi:hypothetical protein